MLFYQDFNEQFEGYTQLSALSPSLAMGCFIRISMNNLKDIHNQFESNDWVKGVVLSGFQWTIWRIYTTVNLWEHRPACCFIRISMNNLKDIHNCHRVDQRRPHVVLSGFQWTIWRIYTTVLLLIVLILCCFIRISMNNLKDIHNRTYRIVVWYLVVLSGFQWTIWRIYTTFGNKFEGLR